jgi:hypothetical protein
MKRSSPRAVFRGQTPGEMYVGTGDAIPEELAAHTDARACGPIDY